jgi:hypothetical protein
MPSKRSVVTGSPLSALLPSFMLSLDERDLSAGTLKVYDRTGQQLTRWLEDNDMPGDVEELDAPLRPISLSDLGVRRKRRSQRARHPRRVHDREAGR